MNHRDGAVWLSRLFRRLLPGDLGAEACDELDRQYLERRARFGVAASRIWYAGHLLLPQTWILALMLRRRHPGRHVRALLRDAAFGIRSLRRAPGFSLTIVATLALCIGVNATVFAALYSMILQPLPFKEPERLVQLFNMREGRSPENRHSESSWLQYIDLRDRTDFVEGVTLRSPPTMLVQHSGIWQRLPGQSASADLLGVFGVRPVIGRFFDPGEVDPGPGHVVVLSQSWWEDEFDADPGVLGEKLIFGDGIPYEIIGVAPRSIEALDRQARFTIPFTVTARDREPGHSRYQAQSHDLWLRLREGVSRGTALERISEIERQWSVGQADQEGRRVFADYDGRVRFDLPHPLRGPLYLLQAGSLFVFLTCLFNVGILVAVRTVRRREELSIRRALGAHPAALVRLLLAESAVLSAVAAALGLTMAWKGIRVLSYYVTRLAPDGAPIEADTRVLGFVVAVSLGIVVLATLFPIVISRRKGLTGTLTGAHPASLDRGSARLTRGIVSGQVAMAFVLSIGAGLLLNSLRKVLAVDPGFTAGRVVEGRLDFSTVRTFYPTRADAGDLKRRIVDAMAAIRGVDDVSLVMFPILSHDLRAGGRSFLSLGASGPPSYDPSINYVSPGFFSTMGIPIVAGRGCGPEDTAESVVVDDLFAHRTFGDVNPVGLELPRGGTAQPMERVIGVSGRANLRGPEQRDLQPFYYRCEPVAAGWWEFSILLRTQRGPGEMIRRMRQTLRAIDPRLPLSYAEVLGESIGDTLAPRRATTLLLAVFAALALALSLVGVFSTLASSVVERRREIGIRMAVGARPWDVYRLVLAEGLSTTVVGLAVGIVGAWALCRFLERFLFEVRPTDLGTYLTIAGLFVAAALLACWSPARIAGRVEPLEVMRTR